MRRMKIPNTFVIVSLLIVLAAIATWIVPGGKFERKTVIKGGIKSEILVQNSFHHIDNQPQIFSIFTSPLKGFIRMAEIIAFIFFIGGAFNIIQKTGAITAGIEEIVRRMKGREKLVIIFIMTLFSFFGAFFGMSEETIPFVLIFVPLALALGYDSITGISLSFLSAGVGFASAFFNPFTVQIAQKFSDIPPLSGWGYRILIWVFTTTITIIWVVRYAEKIRKNPELSPMAEEDALRRKELLLNQSQSVLFHKTHAFVLIILLLAIITLFVGVLVFHWYITELAGLFIAMGIFAGLAGKMNMNSIFDAFIEGAKDIASAALIVAFAGGIIVILEDGKIIDTILYSLSSLLGQSKPLLSAYVMYWIQLILNFFIPSGTTKAALTMPLFAPLADLTGITRQTAVLAYQFGDGFTNMIIPTSGVTMGTLALAKIPYEKWFRWLLPLEILFIILAMVLLIPPVLFQWTGY